MDRRRQSFGNSGGGRPLTNKLCFRFGLLVNLCACLLPSSDCERVTYQYIERMTCSAILLVLKPRRAILSGFNVPNSRESGVLSRWFGKARTSSEAFLTQSHSWLSSVLPEFAPLTHRSSNFSEMVVSRQLVEVFSTASNRPDEGFLRFERVISPCISRISSKERGDMQCAKAAGSLRPRGRLWSPDFRDVSV